MPGTVNDVIELIDDNGRLTVESFVNLGYVVEINRRTFMVSIDTPPEKRKRVILYVMGEPDDLTALNAINFMNPAWLSAYVNVGFNTSYLMSTDSEDDRLDGSCLLRCMLVKRGLEHLFLIIPEQLILNLIRWLIFLNCRLFEILEKPINNGHLGRWHHW